MILIGTIFILKMLTEANCGCPIRCTCTDNAVNCVSKNLEYVPYFESMENNPAIIDLSGNSLYNIDTDDFSFDKSDQVIELYLNHSSLVIIEENSLQELENLQGLYLNDNLLTTLPDDFLKYNENMILLDLSNNYFDVMPVIKSDSLEILNVAKSTISRIPDDALNYLPNLRLLLLQENNIKSINPTVFDQTINLFFVRVSYNPWFCNCKTVKLFDSLTKRKLVELTEVVQCQTQDKTFMNIYTENGAVAEFKRQCSSFGEETSNDEFFLKELENEHIRDLHKSVPIDDDYDIDDDENDIIINEVYYMNAFSLILLSLATVLSLLVGAILGSCITYRYVSRNLKETESTKELVFNFS